MKQRLNRHGITVAVFGFMLLLVLLPLACSDSGDAPNDPNNADLPGLSVGDEEVAEGNAARFDVSLDEAATSQVTFTYFTNGQTAQAGIDFTTVAAADTIPVDSTGVTIVVSTQDDALFESDETFIFTVTAVNNATIIDSVAIGTIIDNDVAGTSFSSEVRPILATSCAKTFCHGGGSAQAGLAMGNATYSEIISATGVNSDGLVVRPGDSAASTLYRKTTDPPVFPSRMPSNGPPYLTVEQQQKIGSWIDEGAQDN